MLDYKSIFKKNSFSMKKNIKEKWFFSNQKKLSNHHYKNCEEYKKIIDTIFSNIDKINEITELPYLHTSLFKNFNLSSLKKNEDKKTFTSSGTTSSKFSKINIDMKTSILQSKTLKKIFFEFLKINSIDCIFFIDKKSVLKGPKKYSARAAAIKGFSQFAKKHYFLINENNEVNIELIEKYTNSSNKNFMLFGFTSFIWNYLIKNKKIKNLDLKNKNPILIHGGGWKKMIDQNINKNYLYEQIKKKLGIEKIHDYYGMVEQTGSIFFECEKGFFHSSIFSDVIMRNEVLNLSKKNKIGLIQVLSILPLSYPGHNLLTEDLGIYRGEDNCKCGRLGKYFNVIGRVPGTDLRGCSDTN